MNSSIHVFIKLILTSLLNFILDFVYKNTRLFKPIIKEDLKFFLNDKISDVTFDFLFMLLLII